MYLRKSSARMSMLVIAAVLVMALLAPIAGYASAAGNRNTAIALTGLTAYELARGNSGPGLLAAIGAGIAWSRYQDRRDEDRYRYRYRNRSDYYRYYGDRDRDRDHRWDRDRHDRGRHYGWDHGKHYGWDRDRDGRWNKHSDRDRWNRGRGRR